MSVAELKKSLEGASTRDKLFLLAWLRHDLRAGSPSRQQQLAGFHAEIDRGEKLTLAEFKTLNRALDQAGL
jgi:hypothetical protein